MGEGQDASPRSTQVGELAESLRQLRPPKPKEPKLEGGGVGRKEVPIAARLLSVEHGPSRPVLRRPPPYSPLLLALGTPLRALFLCKCGCSAAGG